MTLIGNVNNPTTLMAGLPEDAYGEAMRALSAGVEIAAPECAIPLTTSIDNLKAIAMAARDFAAARS